MFPSPVAAGPHVDYGDVESVAAGRRELALMAVRNFVAAMEGGSVVGQGAEPGCGDVDASTAQ